jgi:hypothetical protein
VNIEEFTIEGIPEGYRVFDVDLTPSGQPVALVWNGTDITSIRALARELIELSGDFIHLPYLRCIDENCFAVARPRVRRNDEIGVWVYGAGGLKASFHAGDNIEELLANGDFIVAFYGDEGQTGDVLMSRHAMSVFDHSGNFVWGHTSQFPEGQRLDTFFIQPAGRVLIRSRFSRTLMFNRLGMSSAGSYGSIFGNAIRLSLRLRRN